MYPILLKLGPVTLHTYGLTIAVAFLVVIGLAGRAARRLAPEYVAINPEQIVDFSSITLLTGLLAARLFYVALYWDFFAHSLPDAVAIWQGGLVWYGGLLGGLFGGWFYVRAKRLSFLRVMDQFIPFGVLGHAIGRMGCFLNGCCYGIPTDAWCGVTFPGQAVRVLPVQLFEAAGLFVLYGVLRSLQHPTLLARPGRLFGTYLMSYGVLRFILEFFRGDQTVWWAGLTLQQLISVAVVLVGIGLFGQFRLVGQGRRTNRRT
jgi:phosphatidylglycerol:prolipoprotein diacylglycerol transferase